jgi:hypothetical protein
MFAAASAAADTATLQPPCRQTSSPPWCTQLRLLLLLQLLRLAEHGCLITPATLKVSCADLCQLLWSALPLQLLQRLNASTNCCLD